jgi:pimeloyl-ACP methyl ester carboxylesterase
LLNNDDKKHSEQRSITKNHNIKKVVIVIGMVNLLLLLFVFFPAFSFAPSAPDWVPEPLALWGFDMRLFISRPLINLSSLIRAVGGETAFTYIDSARQITIQSEGLTIVGDLYGFDGSGSKPAILLIHGATPQGRKLGLYRLMGSELAEIGYIVLTIDLRGYGQSDNPIDVHNADNFNFAADVASALAYLESLPDVDKGQLFLVGHSAGGDVAISAVASQTVEVDKLVLLGPGRRYMERGGTPDAPEFDYFRRGDMRFMGLSYPIPANVYLEYRATLSLENHLNYLSQPTHTPLLLLDGELEGKEDQQFMHEIFALISGSKKYVTLTKSDHYVNVSNFGALIIYDRSTLNQLLLEIDTFLSN